VFNITLDCRVEACGSTYTAGAYSVLIYDTDVCGVGGIDVGLSNGALLPFSDAAGSVPASNFVPNAQVYFAFTLESDAVTIDSMTVEQISATSSSGVDVLYDLNPVGSPPGVTSEGLAASLVITPAITPAAPGVPCTLWFSFQLVDAIPSFRVLPSAAATVTMSIIVDIAYHGNSKRVVQTFQASGDSLSSSQGQCDIYIAQNDGYTPDDFTLPSSAYSLTPLSTVFFCMLAFVSLLVIRS